MNVRISIHPGLHQLTDEWATVEVQGNTVGQCLGDLVKQFPEIKQRLFDKDGKFLGHVDICVNLKSSYSEELAKPVKDRDELYIIPIFAGG